MEQVVGRPFHAQVADKSSLEFPFFSLKKSSSDTFIEVRDYIVSMPCRPRTPCEIQISGCEADVSRAANIVPVQRHRRWFASVTPALHWNQGDR